MLPVRLRPAALQDEFRVCVDAGMAEIGRSPLACAKVRGEARRKVVRRFPYVLLYLAEPEHIEVVAVFHTSRAPVEWQERVR